MKNQLDKIISDSRQLHEEKKKLLKQLDEISEKETELYTQLESVQVADQIDPLTKLKTRASMDNNLEKILYNPNKYPLMVMFADLDNFSTINNIYGHQTGDDVLKKLGEIYKTTLRVENGLDDAYRYGGEETLIICTNIQNENNPEETPLETANKIAERLRSDIESTIFIEEKPQLKITASIGCAFLETPPEEISLKNIIYTANFGEKKSKQNGKNRVTLINEILQEDNKQKGKNILSFDHLQKEIIVFYTGMSNAEFKKKIKPFRLIGDIIYTTEDYSILKEKTKLYHFDFGIGVFIDTYGTTLEPEGIINVITRRRKQFNETELKLKNKTHFIYRIIQKLTGNYGDSMSKYIDHRFVHITNFNQRISQDIIDKNMQCLANSLLLGIANSGKLDTISSDTFKDAFSILSEIQFTDLNYKGAQQKIGPQNIFSDFHTAVQITTPLENYKDKYLLATISKVMALKTYIKILQTTQKEYDKDKLLFDIHEAPNINEEYYDLYEKIKTQTKLEDQYLKLIQGQETFEPVEIN